jgi:serine protease inhibitor
MSLFCFYKGDNNMFLSTASIAEIMLICLWGAKTSSETSNYFKQLLNLTEFKNEEIFDHVDETDSNAYSNTLSRDSIVIDKTKIFANKNINVRNDFKNVIKEYFDSEIENLNLHETMATINEWCAANTENKIEKIIDAKEIELKSCLIFVNVVYFKAEFLKQFNACNTVESDFFLENGQKSKLQMMTMTEDLFTCENVPGLSARICELPYIFENLFMSIILPKTSDVKLNEIENEIEQLTLKRAFEQKCEKKVKIQLPKLKFDYNLEVFTKTSCHKCFYSY